MARPVKIHVLRTVRTIATATLVVVVVVVNEDWGVVAGRGGHVQDGSCVLTEGKLYLCVVKDLWSNRIVGWCVSDRMKARIVVAALEMAVARRGGDVAGCIFHSDRGSQYRARKVLRALRRHQMVGSMGNVGTAADNAAAESFFALLQKNVLNTRRWDTRDQIRIAIVIWIERTYNQRRRQQALGRLTPATYETIMTPTTAQAA